jgi:hypothetical protein
MVTAMPEPQDRIALLAAHYSPETGARLVALARALPEAQAEELLELARHIDDDACMRMLAKTEDTWQRTLAHFPGLSIALDVVRNHVEHRATGCPICEAE